VSTVTKGTLSLARLLAHAKALSCSHVLDQDDMLYMHVRVIWLHVSGIRDISLLDPTLCCACADWGRGTCADISLPAGDIQVAQYAKDAREHATFVEPR